VNVSFTAELKSNNASDRGITLGAKNLYELIELRSTERPWRRDHEDRLEQVGLALPVVAREHVEPLAWFQHERAQVADPARYEGLDPQGTRSSSA
jgi:hypothetical protein